MEGYFSFLGALPAKVCLRDKFQGCEPKAKVSLQRAICDYAGRTQIHGIHFGADKPLTVFAIRLERTWKSPRITGASRSPFACF